MVLPRMNLVGLQLLSACLRHCDSQHSSLMMSFILGRGQRFDPRYLAICYLMHTYLLLSQ